MDAEIVHSQRDRSREGYSKAVGKISMGGRRGEHTMKNRHRRKTHHHGPPVSEGEERACDEGQALTSHRTKGTLVGIPRPF